MITKEEVWGVIKELPPDRAPEPDGSIGVFYQRGCPIIKSNVMAVILKLYVGDGCGFTKLNKAHIALIPKKLNAEEIGDYDPISLPHNIPKLFAKVLASQLWRPMKEIIGNNQSAFIKGRHLHDNLRLVRQVVRRIHGRKEPRVFLKLEISRVFDSLSLSLALTLSLDLPYLRS
ncbi:Nucleolysin TIAR [Hordeum vulgare]|nr:Nucleolysin TIAR [Hordeum vulgare]